MDVSLCSWNRKHYEKATATGTHPFWPGLSAVTSFVGGVLLLSLPLLLGDVETDELPLLPVFRPLLAVGLDEFSLAVANVVVVSSGEDVAGAEGVNAVALLDPVLPLSLVHSSVVLVLVGSLSLPDALVPLTVVNVTVGIRVLALPVLLVLNILSLILE